MNDSSKVAWAPASGELAVCYDPTQRALYEAGRSSEYDPWSWPMDLRVGRNAGGCFPEVAVRAHFERSGYIVFLSAPHYPNERGFILFHYRRMRKAGDAAFKRMQRHFPTIDLNEVADLADSAKVEAGLSGGGGDPDLFVFRPGSEERFFVEVKDEDNLHANQLVCFPIIEKHLKCPVKIARIEPTKPTSRDSTGASV